MSCESVTSGMPIGGRPPSTSPTVAMSQSPTSNRVATPSAATSTAIDAGNPGTNRRTARAIASRPRLSRTVDPLRSPRSPTVSSTMGTKSLASTVIPSSFSSWLKMTMTATPLM